MIPPRRASKWLVIALVVGGILIAVISKHYRHLDSPLDPAPASAP